MLGLLMLSILMQFKSLDWTHISFLAFKNKFLILAQLFKYLLKLRASMGGSEEQKASE